MKRLTRMIALWLAVTFFASPGTGGDVIKLAGQMEHYLRTGDTGRAK